MGCHRGNQTSNPSKSSVFLTYTEPQLIHCCLTGFSQRPVHLQRRRGSVCLPENSVPSYRDADRRILAGGGQEYKIAGVTFGKANHFAPVCLHQPPLPRPAQTQQYSYSSYPAQTERDCATGGVQTMYRDSGSNNRTIFIESLKPFIILCCHSTLHSVVCTEHFKMNFLGAFNSVL